MHTMGLGRHSDCVTGFPLIFVICWLFKGPLECQPEGKLDSPIPVASHQEVNDRVEGAVHTRQHKTNLWGVKKFVAQEVKKDQDTQRHSENEEEENGEHDDGEEPACSEVLGAALDSKEEGKAEEQHEGRAEDEVQGSDGDEQDLAGPSRAAHGTQNISKGVQQQGDAPEQARDDGRQVLWAVASAPDGTKHRQAPLNTDGSQEVQAGPVHEKIQEEE